MQVVVPYDGMEVDIAMEVDEFVSDDGIQQWADADENAFQEAMVAVMVAFDMAVMVDFDMEMAEEVEQIQRKAGEVAADDAKLKVEEMLSPHLHRNAIVVKMKKEK